MRSAPHSLRGDWFPLGSPATWQRHLERARAEGIAVIALSRNPRLSFPRVSVAVRSSSGAGVYRPVVVRAPGGVGPLVSCTCAAARGGRRCKHAALALAACGLLSSPVPVRVVAPVA